MKLLERTAEVVCRIDSALADSEDLLAQIAVGNLLESPDHDSVLADAWVRDVPWADYLVLLRQNYDRDNCMIHPHAQPFQTLAEMETPLMCYLYEKAFVEWVTA